MVQAFDEDAWKVTVGLIKAGLCTPFIGAGASVEHVPLARDIAETLSHDFDYPFENVHDLAQVTQFNAIRAHGRLFVKNKFTDLMIRTAKTPDFSEPDQPHALLADLGLPIYLTTNYDDFMYQALEDSGRQPIRAICPWYTTRRDDLRQATSMFRKPSGYNPENARPIVYHLHGHHSVPESLVLTEDDYIDFLVRVSGDPKLLPPAIQTALKNKMLLFVGYSLADWTFRVIFRGLLATQPPMATGHVSVQRPFVAASSEDTRPARIQEYLDDYFGTQNIRIYWKKAREFSTELRQRLDA